MGNKKVRKSNKKDVITLQGLFKDKQKIEHHIVPDDTHTLAIAASFSTEQKAAFEAIKSIVFQTDEWNKLEVFILTCQCDVVTLTFVDQL